MLLFHIVQWFRVVEFVYCVVLLIISTLILCANSPYSHLQVSHSVLLLYYAHVTRSQAARRLRRPHAHSAKLGVAP